MFGEYLGSDGGQTRAEPGRVRECWVLNAEIKKRRPIDRLYPKLSTQHCSGSSEFQIFGDFVDECRFNLILFPEVAFE